MGGCHLLQTSGGNLRLHPLRLRWQSAQLHEAEHKTFFDP